MSLQVQPQQASTLWKGAVWGTRLSTLWSRPRTNVGRPRKTSEHSGRDRSDDPSPPLRNLPDDEYKFPKMIICRARLFLHFIILSTIFFRFVLKVEHESSGFHGTNILNYLFLPRTNYRLVPGTVWKYIYICIMYIRMTFINLFLFNLLFIFIKNICTHKPYCGLGLFGNIIV